MASDQQREILRLVAAGALRPEEGLALLDLRPSAGTVELRVGRQAEARDILRVGLPQELVEATAAAGLHLCLRAGEPPLAISWAELVAQLHDRGRAEVVDARAGIVARLRRPEGAA
ncbi:MAG: hypothetical protein HYU88_09535 [Chloroflexi bacterium]|nr:hypothetical protein [Chloroflexota bacterium]MBI4504424.1 hypothetical protein [Chloroflexota bacterium]